MTHIPESVWFDFGNGLVRHDEDTPQELEAFIAGVQFACKQNGIEDYLQIDNEEEAIEEGWAATATAKQESQSC